MENVTTTPRIKLLLGIFLCGFSLLTSFQSEVSAQVYGTSISVRNLGRDGNPLCCGFTPLRDGIASTRRITSRALGMPQCSDVATSSESFNFYSMGFGGEVQLTLGAGFSNGVGPDLQICETSFGVTSACSGTYPDRVRVLASQDNCTWVTLGTFCDQGPAPISVDLGALAWAKYIRLIDVSTVPPATTANNTLDGFDLDGVRGLYPLASTPVITTPTANASTVISFIQGLRSDGVSPVTAAASNPSQALGVPQNSDAVGSINYVSLGFGGEITLQLSTTCYRTTGVDEIRIVETSPGSPSCASNPEKAAVYCSLNGTSWVLVSSSLCLDGTRGIPANSALVSGATTPTTYAIKYLKIVDVSSAASFTSSADGYDLDGVSVRIGCPGTAPRIEEFEENTESSEIELTTNATGSMLSAFPNPVSSDLTIALDLGYDSDAFLQVYDGSGKLILTETIIVNHSEQASHTFNLANLPNGLYFLIAQTSSERLMRRFLKRAD